MSPGFPSSSYPHIIISSYQHILISTYPHPPLEPTFRLTETCPVAPCAAPCADSQTWKTASSTVVNSPRIPLPSDPAPLGSRSPRIPLPPGSRSPRIPPPPRGLLFSTVMWSDGTVEEVGSSPLQGTDEITLSSSSANLVLTPPQSAGNADRFWAITVSVGAASDCGYLVKANWTVRQLPESFVPPPPASLLPPALPRLPSA